MTFIMLIAGVVLGVWGMELLGIDIDGPRDVLGLIILAVGLGMITWILWGPCGVP